MRKRITYKGLINGNFAIVCDNVPEGMIVDETIEYFQPDEGKVFQHNNEFFDIVIIQNDTNINEYEEVDIPEEE